MLCSAWVEGSTMFCLILLLAVTVVRASTTVMVPMNLTLCDETSENVSRLMSDVYVVQPQQHDYCGQINTSTPVVSCYVTYYVCYYVCLSSQLHKCSYGEICFLCVLC